MNKLSQPLTLTLSICMLIILSLTACKTTVELPDLASANSIIITETHAGNLQCGKSVFEKTYTLERTPTQFAGQALYEFDKMTTKGFSATEILTIPQNIVQSFLVKLGKARLSKEEEEDIIYHIGSNIPSDALKSLTPYLLPEADDKYWDKVCLTTP